ncbi:hypothetical protein ACRJ4W_18290 [Streptomyces sp. GLT-R25]
MTPGGALYAFYEPPGERLDERIDKRIDKRIDERLDELAAKVTGTFEAGGFAAEVLRLSAAVVGIVGRP